MPIKIVLEGGREIEYIYDAAGIKLAKITKGGESGTPLRVVSKNKTKLKARRSLAAA